MKILFFVEPQKELAADFRIGALHAHFFEIKKLCEYMPSSDCRITIGEELGDAVNIDCAALASKYKIGVIPAKALRPLFRNYQDAARAWYRGAYTPAQCSRMAELVKLAQPGFVPDVIIVHESQGAYLQAAYPDALILHHMFGLTYRMPYPMLAQFDPQGLYANALLATEAGTIRQTSLSETERNLLGQIRGWFAAQIVPHDPVWRYLEPHQNTYDKLIMLPLQVDGYYAFNDCCPYENQLEYVEDVLAKTPPNWGVIITEHGAYNSFLDDTTITRLKREHHNLIYIPELKDIPFCSQAALCHVDAVISVSSSVACQALIFDLPIIAAGSTHINALATCSLDQIASVFDLHSSNSNDEMLYFYLTRYNHCRKEWLENGANFFEFLRAYLDRHLDGLRGLDLLPPARPLETVFEELKLCSQWRAWTADLKAKNIEVCPHAVLKPILFADAVSYDLFDTLVNRPFIEPHELFGFIEPIIRRELKNIYFPFHHLRREAEKLARAASGHRVEITLGEIYQQLGVISGLPAEKLELLKSIELTAENAMIYPRQGMLRAWRLTKTWGRPRNILTDIYLEEPEIQTILEKNGLADYDMLYVSATERQRKEDGSIYPIYIAAVRKKFPGAINLLHVGDNPRADGEMARRHGLTSCVIPKAVDTMKKTAVAKLFSAGIAQQNPNSSFLIGLICNRLFSAPQSFHTPDSSAGGSLYKFGYMALGPFVVGYTQWIMRRMKALKSDRAYFLARDAHLVMKAYEILRPAYDAGLPQADYLYCSRRSTVVPAMTSDDNINEVATLNFGTMTIRDFLDSRFGVDACQLPSEILKKHHLKADGSTRISFPRDLPAVMRLLDDIRLQIADESQQERSTYLEYLESIGATDKNKNLAMIDIGYSGTMQRKITELTGCSYQGLYVFTHNYVLHHFQEEVFEAWLANYDDQRNIYRHEANNCIPFLESLLSSEEGSLVKFERGPAGELIKVLLESSNERDRINFVRTVHQGALAFVEDFKNILGPLVKNIEMSPALASFPLLQFTKTPSLADVSAFEGVILENLFAGAEFNVIANPLPYLNGKGQLAVDTYERLVVESKWKEGAKISLSRYLPGNIKEAAIKKVAAIPIHQPANTLTVAEKRKKKLLLDPQKYFADSRFPPFRLFRHLFGYGTVGRIARRLLRSLVFENSSAKP